MEGFAFTPDETFILVTGLLHLRKNNADAFWDGLLEGASTLYQISDFGDNPDSVAYLSQRFAKRLSGKLERWQTVSQTDAEMFDIAEAYNAAEFNYFQHLDASFPLGASGENQARGEQGSELRRLYALYQAAKARYDAEAA